MVTNQPPQMKNCRNIITQRRNRTVLLTHSSPADREPHTYRFCHSDPARELATACATKRSPRSPSCAPEYSRNGG